MVYSRVNKNFNKRIHETLGVGYYNFLMKMRAPVGRPSLATVLQEKKLNNIKYNYQKLKNYYYTIKTKTNYKASHPTMKAFKNKLSEYAKYIKEKEQRLANMKKRLRLIEKLINQKPVNKKSVNKKSVMRKRKFVKKRTQPAHWR